MFEPTEECRVFISRKTSDSHLSSQIIQLLEKYAPDRLIFFDAEKIKGGDKWREKIRENLKISNILLLLLTRPARNNFDWPLYEAGLFESLDENGGRRVVCICADPDDAWKKIQDHIPSQISDKQMITATNGMVLSFLQDLYRNAIFTNTRKPLSTKIGDDDLGAIAAEICSLINGIDPGDQFQEAEYTNPYIQLIVPPGDGSLEKRTELESNQSSLNNLFGLGKEPPGGGRWTWGHLLENIPTQGDIFGFNRKWTRQLSDAVHAMKNGRTVPQLTGRFLAMDNKLYRPELEVYRRYLNGRMTVDVTFSEQVQDSWLRDAHAPMALAAHLALASRIRHELVEPYLDEVARGELLLGTADLEALFEKLTQVIEIVEHDGYFINMMTRRKLYEAFEASDLEELGALETDYGKGIAPSLRAGLQNKRCAEVKEALERWQKNNLRFLRIGLKRYETLLRL